MGREPKERKDNSEGSGKRDRVAIGGQKVKLTKAQADRIGEFKVCAGGFGYGQKNIFGDNGIGPHIARFVRRAVWYDEHLVGHELLFSKERARRAYSCRFCGRYMGCDRCLETVLLSEIECAKCNEYANEVGWWHHGNFAKDRWDGLTTMQAFTVSQKKWSEIESEALS